EVSGAARLIGGKKQVPQACGLGARLQFLNNGKHSPGTKALGLLVEAPLVRVDVIGHEIANALAEVGAPRALADVHFNPLLAPTWRLFPTPARMFKFACRP